MPPEDLGPLLPEARDFYDRVAEVYNQKFAHPQAFTFQQTAWLARNCQPGLILDIGCGTGRMFKPLKDAGFKPVGLDCAPKMLKQARKVQSWAPLVRADAGLGLPFGNQVFQTAISLHATVIHLIDPKTLGSMAREVYRVLKPGGQFVVEIPHPSTFPKPSKGSTWTPFTNRISCRLVGSGLYELRLHEYRELRTRVRVLDIPDLKEWLRHFSSLELYPGFQGGRFKERSGDIIVVRARK
ncbi:MAG: methyltransferase domain-containing protein [Desulfarculaceae bacterium]